MLLLVATMLTAGVTDEDTLMVIAFDVTVLIVLQGAFDVTSTVITSLLASVVVV